MFKNIIEKFLYLGLSIQPSTPQARVAIQRFILAFLNTSGVNKNISHGKGKILEPAMHISIRLYQQSGAQEAQDCSASTIYYSQRSFHCELNQGKFKLEIKFARQCKSTQIIIHLCQNMPMHYCLVLATPAGHGDPADHTVQVFSGRSRKSFTILKM